MLSLRNVLIALGVLAVLTGSYWGYNAYQKHIEFETFMAQAITFRKSIDETPGIETISLKQTHNTGHADGRSAPQVEALDQSPVKVKILNPDEVALYSDGDPNASVRLKKGELPDTIGVWRDDEMITQWVELPNGETVKLRLEPGLELQPGERISAQYIENNREMPGNYIESEDGQRYTVPDGADREMYMQKVLWADSLGVSVEEVERLMDTGELVVKGEGEPMTEADTETNFNFLRNIPKFLPFLRSIRPETAVPSDDDMQPLPDNQGGEQHAPDMPTSPAHPTQSPLMGKQAPLPSEPPTVSNQATQSSERMAPERFSKAQQLIDQYGTEEGLRRFREIDPEAAQQFDRERRPPPAREVPSEPKPSAQ